MGREEKAKKDIARKEEVRKAAEAYANGCRRVLNEWNNLELGRADMWDGELLEECAENIAEMCRKLHSHYVEKEYMLYSIDGLKEFDKKISAKGKDLEEHLEAEERDLVECMRLLEEDTEELFSEAIACIDRQR